MSASYHSRAGLRLIIRQVREIVAMYARKPVMLDGYSTFVLGSEISEA
jgi:hypothetical protein